MTLTPNGTRILLIAHVVSSVGWLGAVAAFLVLSIIALRSDAPHELQACYVAMDLLGRHLIVPLSVLTLATGITQSIATSWGLFRHYWVAAKLVLTVLATIGLVVHQYTLVAAAAARVAAVPLPDVELQNLGFMLVRDAALAIMVLFTATVLSIFKPWGPIRQMDRASRWIGWTLAAVVIAFLVAHLSSGRSHH